MLVWPGKPASGQGATAAPGAGQVTAEAAALPTSAQSNDEQRQRNPAYLQWHADQEMERQREHDWRNRGGRYIGGYRGRGRGSSWGRG